MKRLENCEHSPSKWYRAFAISCYHKTMIADFLLLPPQLSGFALVAGFLLIAHAHNRKSYISYLLKRGTKTEGRVVEIRKNPGSLIGKEEGEGYAPVVEYTTISGNALKHYSTTFREPCNYEVGQKVAVWYTDYKSKREATLEDDLPGDLPMKFFIIGIILFLLGLPRLLIGLINLV